mgnify:CR=1 FL=1
MFFTVKVGGMRVATHKKPEKPADEKPEEDDAEEYEVYVENGQNICIPHIY